MKEIINFNKLSKKDIINLYIRKVEEYENLEAKFYEMEKERNEALKKILIFEEKAALSKQRAFGAKTEQTKYNSEKVLINEAEKTLSKESKEDIKTESEKKKRGRKAGSKNFDKDFLEANVSEIISIEPEEIELVKNNKNVIELEPNVFYKVSRIPGKYLIKKIVCKKYFDKTTKAFYQGTKKDDPFPHSIFTPELITSAMINKFMLGLPYYRQTVTANNEGLNISRQLLCNYQIKATDILKPIYNSLKEKLLATTSRVICADETTLNVLESDKKMCYAWVYTSTFYDYPIYIYEFCENRKKENVIKFLKDFKGYLLTDCYAGYESLENIENAFCWAHARRKYMEILKSLSPDQLKDSVANKIVKLIDKLFDKEKEFKAKLLSPSEIKVARNSKEYLETLNEIFKILKETDPEKGSALEGAIKYMLDREKGFRTFLEDGHIDLSNNISERAIKPFVIDRKNFLFSNTINGAESSLIFFSIQQTARANGVDPYKYIVCLLNELGKSNPPKDIEYLLPWNFKE